MTRLHIAAHYLGGSPPFIGDPRVGCQGRAPTRRGEHDLFFPGTGKNPSEARAICHACPFLVDCREWAVARPWVDGVWGATTFPERRIIRRCRAARAAGRPCDHDLLCRWPDAPPRRDTAACTLPGSPGTTVGERVRAPGRASEHT